MSPFFCLLPSLMYFSNDNTVFIMCSAQGPVTCTDGYTPIDLHYSAHFIVTVHLFIGSLFPTGLGGIGLLFLTFFFFWKWIMFCQSAPLHPGLTSSQANNPIKANTLNVNWPYRHPFPICHWQHFWEEFLSEFFFSSSHTCEIPIHHNNQCWVSIYQALNASTLLWQVEPRGFTF